MPHIVSNTTASVRVPARLLAVALAIACAGPAPAESLPQVTNQLLLRSSTTWNGATLPAYPDGQPEISIYRLTVPAGASLPEHRHPVILGGYVLSGQLTVTTEHGQSTVMQAGDASLEVVNTWHSSRNEGDTPVEIIVFYLGTPGAEITQRREP